MSFQNIFTQKFSVQLPIVQAPFPFGLIPLSMIAKINQLGGLGLISIESTYEKEQVINILEKFTELSKDLHLCFFHHLPHKNQEFEQILQSILPFSPKTIFFAKGIPDLEIIQRLRNAEISLIAVVKNISEAVVAQKYQMDAVVLQGAEAGGVRSGFVNKLNFPDQPAFSLLQQSRSIIKIPLIYWGDIAKYSDILAMLLSGAKAIMLDRPILTCKDSELHEEQYYQLNNLCEVDSLISNSYGENPMRILKNTFKHPPHGIPFWENFFKEFKNQKPLPVSLTPSGFGDDLTEMFSQITQGLNKNFA